MPTKAPADSAQMKRKTAVIDDIKARLDAYAAEIVAGRIVVPQTP